MEQGKSRHNRLKMTFAIKVSVLMYPRLFSTLTVAEVARLYKLFPRSKSSDSVATLHGQCNLYTSISHSIFD